MTWHPIFKRHVQEAYREGVGDYLNHGHPSPMRYGEPGSNFKKCKGLEAARRRGFEDAKAKKVDFPMPFDLWAECLDRLR